MKGLSFGDQAPRFSAPALSGNPNYMFDAAAGHVILMLFSGSGAWPACADAIRAIQANRDLFDDVGACFFGISTDPSDVTEGRIARQLPGIRWFLDHDQRISTLYGAVVDDGNGRSYHAPYLLLLDHRLRVAGRFEIDAIEAALAATKRLVATGVETQTAPVLIVPRIFEPEVCQHLIKFYDEAGGVESGFMREKDGMTVRMLDPGFKRRSDYIIDDVALQNALKVRLVDRLLPEMERAFQYTATRIERWLVACYDSGKEGVGGGFFSAHRDNTTRGTAHRRFACTINLNAEEFEGGELRFPEFGSRQYRAPTGGAVIFSCSLLHEAMPVTAGRRYAFLPFFYDEEGAAIREKNRAYLALEGNAAGTSDVDPGSERFGSA